MGLKTTRDGATEAPTADDPTAANRATDSAADPAAAGTRAPTVPFRRTVPRLARDPLAALESFGGWRDGNVVRLNLGLFRPYLLTRPEHVQHVLRDNPDRYRREGMLWEALQRLEGDGLAGEGPTWRPRRRLVQPLLSVRSVTKLVEPMAEAIAEVVDEWDPAVRERRPLDIGTEMTRLTQRSISRAFFGGRIGHADADRLGPAIAKAMSSLNTRLVLPFVPDAVPLPGDRAFRRAVRTVDDVIYPLVRQSQDTAPDDSGVDLVSLLTHAKDENGDLLTDRQIRDDLVAMFVAGTDTTAVALSWLWVVLDQNPDVAQIMYAELDRVLDGQSPTAAHLAELTYTRMVIQELLRMYPVGWFLPRLAASADVIDGVRIKAGATVVISPYLTHRLPDHWERPDEFNPLRFTAEAAAGRHRFAYLPFGAGPHTCVGANLFTTQAQLVAATVLRRYRPVSRGGERIPPRAGAALHPSRRVEVVFQPRS